MREYRMAMRRGEMVDPLQALGSLERGRSRRDGLWFDTEPAQSGGMDEKSSLSGRISRCQTVFMLEMLTMDTLAAVAACYGTRQFTDELILLLPLGYAAAPGVSKPRCDVLHWEQF